jgi:chromosome segregation ATPase
VRDRDASVVSGLAARQEGDAREVQAIRSSVLSIESSVKSVCERHDPTVTDVLRVKQAVERVGSALSDLKTDVCEQKGKVGSIESWREATEAVLWDVKREVRELREELGRDVVSVGELRERLFVEVVELKPEVGLLERAKGRLEAEIGEARKQFAAERNSRRFCEFCYGVHGCDKSFGDGIRFLELAADSGHSDAQHQYSRCHYEGSFVVKDY